MSRITPTQRSLKWARDHGMKVWVVERWLPYAGKFGKRQDMFGIIDIVALTEIATIGIQTCSGSTHSEHLRKMTASSYTAEWLKAYPSRVLEIWSWSKRVHGKRHLWTLRREQLLPSAIYVEDRKADVFPYRLRRYRDEDSADPQGSLVL